MPLSVYQIEDALGSYVAPNGDFTMALAQALPRLYEMGLWKDSAHEVSMESTYGYISLPEDTDAVLSCSVNNSPVPLRSMWHDIRIAGRQPIISHNYGLIDSGFHPVLLDMRNVQEVDRHADVVALTKLVVFNKGTTTTPQGFSGTLRLTTDTEDSSRDQTVPFEYDVADEFVAVTPAPFKCIAGIRYSGVTDPLDIVDPNFPEKVIATIPSGTGVLRYRRFLTPVSRKNNFIHLLVKRKAPSHLTPATEVHMTNIGALKHALLAIIAEDNSDLERSAIHWKRAGYLLDMELKSHTGGAKPTLSFDLAGGNSAANIHNLM